MSVGTDAAYENIAAITDFANSDGNTPIYQTFTAITNLYFYGIQLYIRTPQSPIGGENPDISGLNLIVYNGSGTGGSIFAEYSNITVPANTTPSWYSFQFPSPYSTLTAHNIYTVAATGLGAKNLLWGYSIVTPYNTYPGGHASFQPPSNLFFVVQTATIPVNPAAPTSLGLINGSAAAPSIAFISSTNTGIFYDTTTPTVAPGVGVSVGGTEIALVNATGIQPAADATYNLGSLTNRFNNLYVSSAGATSPVFQTYNLTGTLDGYFGSPPTVTYTSQTVTLVRVGNIVFVNGNVQWSSATGGTGALAVAVLGAPSVAANTAMSVMVSNLNPPGGFPWAASTLTGAFLLIIWAGNNTGIIGTVTLPGGLSAGVGNVQFAGCYQTT